MPTREITPRAVLLDLARRQRRRVALTTVFWSSHQACEAMVPVAIGLVIDRAVEPGDGTAMVLSVLGLLALFTVLTFSFRAGLWFVAYAVLEEAHRLRLAVVHRLIDGRGVRTERQTGEVLSIAVSDAHAAAEVIEVASRMVAAAVGLIVTAVVLVRIDWSLGLGVMVGVPAVVLGLNALAPQLERRTAAQQQTSGLAAATATDLLSGLRPLRGFGGTGEAVRRYRTASRTSLRATVGAGRAAGTLVGASTFGVGLLLAAVAALAGWYGLQGRISVGELITIVGLSAFLSDPVLNLADCVAFLARGRASAGRVAELLSAPAVAATGDRDATPGALVFDEVRSPGLDGLHLTVAPGELLGVVTAEPVAADAVGDLLSGQRRPDSGTVTLGGVALDDLDPAGRTAVLLVEPHTPDFFGDTVRTALQTRDDQDDAELERAGRAAALDELLAGAGEGDGLDRPVQDRGTDLSGGQRQRLALARALAADRPLLVLRDPTTAVDAVTEHSIAEGLRAVRGDGGRTTVLLTASPPLLDRCDRVLLLHGGRVVAEGRHADLLGHPDYARVVLR